MNDTTRWIMIILLLLLIAAAVFMLLRSPGKDRDNGNGSEAMVAGRDTDRDGVPDRQEGRVEPAATADRGVYDQEADTRAREAVDRDVDRESGRDAHLVTDREADRDLTRDLDRDLDDDDAASHDTTTAPAEPAPHDDLTGTSAPAAAAPTSTAAEVGPPQFEDGSAYGSATADDTAGLVRPEAQDVDADAEAAEHYRPEAGAVEEDRAGVQEDRAGVQEDRAGDGAPSVHPLTDEEIDEGGSAEPLTRDEQAAGVSPVEHRDDTTGDEQDSGERTYEQGTLYDETPAGGGLADRSVGTPEQALDRDDRGPADTAQQEREYAVGDESTTYRAADGEAVVVDDTATGWDAPPADTGTGAPQTADEIVEGPDTDTDTDTDVYAPVFTEAAYGPGSAEPLEDGTGPAGWEIKGNIGSMLFHTPDSPSYDAVRSEVWFESEEAARAAGFAHWDRRRR